MPDLDPAPSSIRDDSICESSLHPNKSSGDIGERLRSGPSASTDYGVHLRKYQALCDESAAEIERLKREVASLQRALLFWMPGVDLRLDEATRERAAQDAGLLAGYTEPLDGPCWGDGMLDRALSAESAVAAACALLTRYLKETPLGNQPHMIAHEVEEFLASRASAIRAKGQQE